MSPPRMSPQSSNSNRKHKYEVIVNEVEGWIEVSKIDALDKTSITRPKRRIRTTPTIPKGPKAPEKPERKRRIPTRPTTITFFKQNKQLVMHMLKELNSIDIETAIEMARIAKKAGLRKAIMYGKSKISTVERKQQIRYRRKMDKY